MKAQLNSVLRTAGALVLLCVLMIWASACATLSGGGKADVKLVEISKGPCYGSCPVYKMAIYQNGTALYEGQDFTERKGEHVKKISLEQLKNLRELCESANLWEMPDAFRSRLPDMPTVTITYYEPDRSKTIMGKEDRPQSVMAIEKALDEIAESGGWAPKAEAQKGKEDSGALKNEIIVQLMEGVDGNIWVRQYAKHNMQLIKRLSPRSFYWLVSFDTKTASPESMIEMIRQDAYVVSAEFNRTVESRGQ